jgi:ectoine hydroxylase-related dioxygenase (phytanoyl-CoA dioxygenase family)
MRDQLTPEQVAFYRENGFLVIENFLDAEELAEWRRVTDEAVEQRLTQSQGKAWIEALNNQADPDAYYAQVFTQCIKLADTHPGMRKLMFDPRLGKVAATLAGVDGIRIWHDQALIKPPYGNPTAWHLDDPYWSFYSRDALSLWMALDDATLANGCMWYLPGSHKTATYANVGIGQNLGDLFKVYPQWRQQEAVACPCPAGTAVYHNGLTAHGAGANMTPRPRRAMTCAYMPDGSVFNGKNKNVLPDAYFATLKEGDPLNDDTINPLIWHRNWER